MKACVSCVYHPDGKPETQQVAVLDRGKVVHHGPSSALRSDEAAQARLLGVAE